MPDKTTFENSEFTEENISNTAPESSEKTAENNNAIVESNDNTDENSITTVESSDNTEENSSAGYSSDSDCCAGGCSDVILTLYILYRLLRFIIRLIIKFFRIVFANQVLLILFILIVICFVLRAALRD